MSEDTFYITTPIYYVNDKPHLGHAYTTIMCDILRRYHALLGKDTYFMTGTDEHGEKIFREAQKKNVDLFEMIDENSNSFRDLWPKLNITNDDFIRTTQQRHKKVVLQILQYTYDKGDIYLGEHEGDYCVGCEQFYTEKDVEANPGICPIHETALEHIKEQNYFFRLSKYQDWLRDKIENDPVFLQPKQYRNELLALLREPLDDLCISRPVERMHHGIPLPFDDKFVTYVWYDALTNYISGLGYPDDEKFARYWPNSMHMTAKDIVRHHGVYWPCMLKAADIPCFRSLRVHGYWTVEGRKISKSLGNFLDPVVETEKYGLDPFRYFLAREMSFGSDSNYNAEGLVRRNNAELANDLGNLMQRVTTMVGKYFDGKMPAASALMDEDKSLLAHLKNLRKELPAHLEATTLHLFLKNVMVAIAETNRYVTSQAPWTLAKQEKMERVGTVLAVTAEMIVGVGQLLYPVMPSKMSELLDAFGVALPTQRFTEGPIPAGVNIKQPEKGWCLFPQLEPPEVRETAAVEEPPVESQAEPIKDEIAFEDFAKIDLRTATVIKAERVPKTDKLLKLQIDTGVDQRQIIAGIAEKYTPEDLVGRQVIVVANLTPRKLRGETSQGMLLCARSGEDLIFITPENASKPGAEVS